MNRDHDVKRPRLGHASPTSSRVSPPHLSTSALHLPHHTPQHSGRPSTVPAPVTTSGPLVGYQAHSEPLSTSSALSQQSTPTTATHPYPNHSLPPLGPQAVHPPGHPASAPPFVGHPPPGETRPGYGVVERHQPRGFTGPSQSRPPTAPLPPSPADRRPSAPSGASAGGAVMMEHQLSQQHPGAFGHHMEGPPVNGAPPGHGPNGMHPPYPPGQPPTEQFPAPVPPGYHQAGGIAPYGAPPYHPQAGTNWAAASSRTQAAKKHQRAQIACNNCRARKQKCDEMTPSCSYCLQEKMTCEYRHVAPPKVDKNIVAIQDKQKDQDAKIEKMGHDIAVILDLLKRRYDTLPTDTPASLPPLDVPVSESEALDRVHVPEQPLGSHSTGAQHLFKDFPKMEEWYRAAGVANDNYPYELERRRGVLRLFGSGWSGDDPKPSSGEVPTFDDGQDADSLYPPKFVDPPANHYNIGGLNPNGSLRLDAPTVKRLHDSYITNMWVIYPIFHGADLKQRVQTFITKYSPNEPKPQTPPVPNSPRGLKRSYSQLEEGPDRGYSGPPKRVVDHSLNNAIILLVLAIGKLCEHDEYLMSEEIKEFPDPYPQGSSTSHSSSPNFARPSPSRSATSSASPKFPDNIIHNNASDYSSDIHMQMDSRSDRWNVLRYPGLAYYIEAVQILGECSGARGLEASQANVLAGLYWGQIGCVLQSSHFIHIAANTIEEMLHQYDPADIYGVSGDLQTRWDRFPEADLNELQLFLVIFWSALQIECDILAELERLPSSRLLSLSDRDSQSVSIPNTVIGVTGSVHHLFRSNLDTSEVMSHFLNQYTLRKHLNRAHVALYGTSEERRDARQKAAEQKLPRSWADLSAEELWDMLSQWRNNLQPFLQWKDSDPPATDILNARLRAKYYGAAYMMSRVLLKQVLSSPQNASLNYEALKNQSFDDLRSLSGSDIGPACRRCILAALKSTIAFDNVFMRHGRIKRAKLPNIHGTFSAQFSNMLTVACAFVDERLHQLVPDEFIPQVRRTVHLLHNLSPVSPVFETSKRILMKAYEAVMVISNSRGIKSEYGADQRPMVGTNWPTPQNQYGSPGVQSIGGRSSVGPGTPRYHDAVSAASSFVAPR